VKAEPKIIVVAGYLAAGKSSFTLRLSSELGIPYLIKDTFKSALCSIIDIDNRSESRRFSAVTFDGMMYVCERLLEHGYPLIIEGNFVPAGVKPVDEASVIRELVDKYHAQSLTFRFQGDIQTLYRRFVERDKLPERGDANRAFTDIHFSNFNTACHNLDTFSIGGEEIVVDTTDFSSVDFEALVNRAREFLAAQ